MPDLSNNSFIPKRGPANKKKRRAPSRPIYVFTILSYVLMFATLIASAGVYLYGNYIDQQMNDAVTALNTEIGSFEESDMQRVLEFDLRLTQAYGRLDNSVSIVSVFDALEAATVDTVQVVSLNMKRKGDEIFVLEAAIATDNFDSTIFQRGVYQRNQTISNVVISDIQNSIVSNTINPQEDSSGVQSDVINFKATLEVPLSSVPYVVSVGQSQPIVITQPTIELPEPESELIDGELNQDII
ncbi:MAG: hypothetical protein LR008_00310 [Candidatus Pacebacteria bacterium]|nr:hypothetical protein [Candidatus Paceibacterota bacterium]